MSKYKNIINEIKEEPVNTDLHKDVDTELRKAVNTDTVSLTIKLDCCDLLEPFPNQAFSVVQ